MVHLAVYLVLVRDGKVLLTRRYNTGWRDGNWSMIAGHVETGETATEALIRETKEEARIDIEPKDLRHVHTLHRKSIDREYIDIFFTADSFSGEPLIGEPDKCNAMAWFAPEEMPDNTLPYVLQGVTEALKGVTYSESGWQGDAV